VSTHGGDRDAERLADGVRAGDRTVLARAITLVESTSPTDEALAQEVLTRLLPHTGGAVRVGISGAPGVGKSTLIDALGMHLVESGYRVAVLAVDPSSARSGGSLLGDKTRMERLAQHPAAYIRPSPAARTLGGVARRTREALLVCEAAGFDVVLVETVGVGQSEAAVAGMADFFLLLVQPGAGDELQGIKRGVIELADAVAVTKADGETLAPARRAAADYGAALSYLRPRSVGWSPRAVTVSAVTGEGIPELWALVEEHRRALSTSGELERLRRGQRTDWLHAAIEEHLSAAFRSRPGIRERLARAERAVAAGESTPGRAAADLVSRPPSRSRPREPIFAEIAADPLFWFWAADDLLSAAEALKPLVEAYWQLEHRRAKRRQEGRGLVAFSYVPDPRGIYFMLVGYALENLCKGELIQRGKIDVETVALEKGELPKEMTSHNLTVLLQRLGFQLDQQDALLVKRLERSVVWAARYPVPKSTDHSSLMDPEACREREGDVEAVENLVTRVKEFIDES
jgi:LAO/AO transport system kinase